MAGTDPLTKSEAVAEAVKTRKGPKPKARFRAVRGVPLLYDEPTTAIVSVPLKILDCHAQQDVGIPGGRRPTRSRYVQPELMWLFDSSKKQEALTFILFRGKAEIPINDGNDYDFLRGTSDRNPSHNCYASVWLVTPQKKAKKKQ